MNRYWRGRTKNGKFVSEAHGAQWHEIETDLEALELVTEERVIKLPDAMEYVQAKTASADLGSSDVTIESRYIGFFINNDSKIIVRVDEKTGDVGIEIESTDP